MWYKQSALSTAIAEAFMRVAPQLGCSITDLPDDYLPAHPLRGQPIRFDEVATGELFVLNPGSFLVWQKADDADPLIDEILLKVKDPKAIGQHNARCGILGIWLLSETIVWRY
jgi:hypothetical protein